MAKYIQRYFFFLFLLFFSTTNALVMRQKPIPFSKKRIELTKQYKLEHYGIQNPTIYIDPKMVIIHWTAMDSFERSYAAFVREELHESREDLKSSNLGVSAHFLVDRDGIVYKLMDEKIMARHCIGLNHCAIGIENVGGENGVENLTNAQLIANYELVAYLKKKYPKIQYLIGHYEYQQFEKHSLFKEKSKSYRTEKQDPGIRFMHALRKKIKQKN